MSRTQQQEQGAPPLPIKRLESLCQSAAGSVITTSQQYDHTQVNQWNQKIIDILLKKILTEPVTNSNGDKQQRVGTLGDHYKFIVYSSIIQKPDPAKHITRTAIHTASGAYWNEQKDGIVKWTGSQGDRDKGMDIVVSLIWIAL